MKKKIDKWFVIVFCAAFVILCVTNIAWPQYTFSENENRALTTLPSPTVSQIADGSFMKKFESYSTDQFVGRSLWVSIKAKLEKIIGKKENNGVYFAKDGYLIEKLPDYNQLTVDNNLSSLAKLDSTGKYNITLMAVPTAFEVLQHKLPSYAYTDTVPRLIEDIKSRLSGTGVQVVDPTEALKENSDRYIYYRTDHHQTALGSYITYTQLAPALGFEAMAESDFDVQVLSDEFYGTTWSKAMVDTEADTIYAYVPKTPAVYHVEFPAEQESMDSLYSMKHLTTKDKYSVYLDGNHPIAVIDGAVENGKSLAVFKDSYAHSLLPFLANHYQSIHVLDLRYYSMDPTAYLDQYGITDVLVLYNTTNFMTDTNIVKLGAFIK